MRRHATTAPNTQSQLRAPLQADWRDNVSTQWARARQSSALRRQDPSEHGLPQREAPPAAPAEDPAIAELRRQLEVGSKEQGSVQQRLDKVREQDFRVVPYSWEGFRVVPIHGRALELYLLIVGL